MLKTGIILIETEVKRTSGLCLADFDWDLHKVKEKHAYFKASLEKLVG